MNRIVYLTALGLAGPSHVRWDDVRRMLIGRQPVATTETVVDATVADTFRVLSTAHLYPEWVVGANATARGTRVVMDEGPGDLASRLVFNPLADLLLRGRNVEALRRLKRIVETRAGTAPTRA